MDEILKPYRIVEHEPPTLINLGPVQMSANIGKLATALSKAQGLVKGATKDASNPFFNKKYADLEAVWDAFREAFTSNGLSLLQIPTSTEKASVSLTTMLLHGSGEWVMGTLLMYPKEATPQGVGSCLTYMRRYTAAGYAGVTPAGDDDDGNAATGKKGTPVTPFTEALQPNALLDGVVMDVTTDEDGYVVSIAAMDGDMVFRQNLLPCSTEILAECLHTRGQIQFAYTKKGKNLELVKLVVPAATKKEVKPEPQPDGPESEEGTMRRGFLKAYGRKEGKNQHGEYTKHSVDITPAGGGPLDRTSTFGLSQLAVPPDEPWTPDTLEAACAEETPVLYYYDLSKDGKYKNLTALELDREAMEGEMET